MEAGDVGVLACCLSLPSCCPTNMIRNIIRTTTSTTALRVSRSRGEGESIKGEGGGVLTDYDICMCHEKRLDITVAVHLFEEHQTVEAGLPDNVAVEG